MSATIIPFLKDQSFDPELVQVMGRAFDGAAKNLHDRGQPALVRDIIAKRIIDIAKTGERDPDKICERVLRSFGMELR
jgi:hypothetical protein